MRVDEKFRIRAFRDRKKNGRCVNHEDITRFHKAYFTVGVCCFLISED